MLAAARTGDAAAAAGRINSLRGFCISAVGRVTPNLAGILTMSVQLDRLMVPASMPMLLSCCICF